MFDQVLTVWNLHLKMGRKKKKRSWEGFSRGRGGNLVTRVVPEFFIVM